MSTTEYQPGIEPAPVAPHRTENRNRKLELIQEALARSQMDERVQQAASHRTALQLATAQRLHRRSQRLQRRAENASRRARRALARVVM